MWSISEPGCSKMHKGICSGNSSRSLACLKPIVDLWNKKFIYMHFHVHKTFISWLYRDNCISEHIHTHQTYHISVKCRILLHETMNIQVGSTALKIGAKKKWIIWTSFGCNHNTNPNKNDKIFHVCPTAYTKPMQCLNKATLINIQQKNEKKNNHSNGAVNANPILIKNTRDRKRAC